MRLEATEFNFESTLDCCIEGIITDIDFKDRLISFKNTLINAGADYITCGNAGTLHSITAVDTSLNKDPKVIGTIHKSELINLYEYYFRNEKKEARKIYDAILNSAKEKCPFCGGIGTAKNLDHYLPKAHFPQFSVLPQNLVPSCRDCNMDGKSDTFATTVSASVIQPYLDKDHFFSDQWVFADYILPNESVPAHFKYYVEAPEKWIQSDKDRVQQHFDDFELATKYSVKAGELLDTTLAQLMAMRSEGCSNEQIINYIVNPAIKSAPFFNHWQRGMFQALHKSLSLDLF